MVRIVLVAAGIAAIINRLTIVVDVFHLCHPFRAEALCWYYAENNPIDNQKIRDSFAKLRSQFPNLSMQGFDPIFDTVSDLCTEGQRLAFYEGLRLGVTLMIELAVK